MKELIRKNILEAAVYVSARNIYNANSGILLDANESPYGKYNRYPDPQQKDLKEVLSTQNKMAKDQIFIGNGSDEIIDLLIRLFCEPYSDKILSFTPSYGMYKIQAQINGVKVDELALKADFNIDLETFDRAIQNNSYKLLFICNPNNPSGNSFEEKTLKYILQNFKGIVVIDEAYIQYSGKESKINDLNKFKNLVVLQTLSKSTALAALRIGVAYANKEIIDFLNRIKLPYNVNSVSQKIALKYLKNRTIIDRNIQKTKIEKEILRNFLVTLPFVKQVYPSDTNFILLEVEDAVNLTKHLLTEGIIIRNRHSEIKNCVRISIGNKTQNNYLKKKLISYK